MKVHVVEQGECLSSIAHTYGFEHYKALYDHPDNADFRKQRPDPAVILPGDEIVVPELKSKSLALATGQKHRIVVKRPTVRLRVRLRDRDGAALANLDYTLEFAGGNAKGRTAGDGLIEQAVPASIKEATVEIATLNLKLRLSCGTLDPVDAVTGAQVRLNNLGFDAGAVDGDLGPRSQDAIRRFQEAQGLTASGELDDQTRAKLVGEQGS
jgi:N-acetylmuramoyl-L-alanine amidase